MCMTFVFGVMIEFTICHFAKNQELSRGEAGAPNLLVDSTMSTLFDTSNDTLGSLRRLKSSTAEARDRFFKGLDPLPTSHVHSRHAHSNGRTLRADEPDIHTIQPMDNSMEPMLVKSVSGDSFCCAPNGQQNGPDARLYGLQEPGAAGFVGQSTDTLHLTNAMRPGVKPAVSKLRSQVSNFKPYNHSVIFFKIQSFFKRILCCFLARAEISFVFCQAP